MKEIKSMKSSEMVSEYNILTGKTITKFASRAKGEEQLLKAREKFSTAQKIVEVLESESAIGCPHCGERRGQDFNNGEYHCNSCDATYCEMENGKRKIWFKNKRAKAASEGIKESWNDEQTRAARAIRNRVFVKGFGEFKSVKAAFVSLGLPLTKHIRFRIDLKNKKQKTFNYNEQEYEFNLLNKLV